MLVHEREQLAQRLRLLGKAVFHQRPASTRSSATTLGAAKGKRRSVRFSRSRRTSSPAASSSDADNKRIPGAIAIGVLQMREQLALLVVHVGGRRRIGGAARSTIGTSDGARLRAERDRRDSAARRLAGRLACGEDHQEALESQREADRRHVGSAERAHEAVVAAAAAQAALRAEHIRRNLENRASVIIETAHDARIDRERNSDQVQKGLAPRRSARGTPSQR